MSGSVGGVDAAIPLSAGRIGQAGGNSLAYDPAKFVGMLEGVQNLQRLRNQNELFPGQQQLQQQEIQQRGNELQLFPGRQQQQQLELQRGAIANDVAQRQLTALKNNQVANGLIPLILKGEKATLADATNSLGQMAAAGYDVAGVTESLKASGATSGMALVDAVRVPVVQSIPEIGLPRIQYQDNGNELIPINTNAIAGPIGRMGAAIPKGPTIEQQNELKPVVNQETGGTDFAPRVNVAPMVGTGVGGAPSAGGPQMSPMPPQSGSASSTSGPSVRVPPTVPGAIGPARTAALGETGLTGAKKFADISAAGDAARGQDALLSTMQAEAQNFRPGPGADTAMAAKRFMLGFGAQIGTTFGIKEKELAAQESVDKIANQLADAMGVGSDARLHVNQGANPSSHNTPQGLDLIIRQLRGVADYAKVRQQLAADYPDKSDSQGFLAKVAGNLDPRVFMYNRLAPGEQRNDYFKNLSDKSAFKAAYKWAENNRVLGATQ